MYDVMLVCPPLRLESRWEKFFLERSKKREIFCSAFYRRYVYSPQSTPSANISTTTNDPSYSHPGSPQKKLQAHLYFFGGQKLYILDAQLIELRASSSEPAVTRAPSGGRLSANWRILVYFWIEIILENFKRFFCLF